MFILLQETLWKQFGATIDMLGNAIEMCPEKYWNRVDQFWYKAYHTIFYLDYYLTPDPATFAPPSPFSFSEFDPSGKLPERVYTKAELLNYVLHCREKCITVIGSLTEENMLRLWTNDYRSYPFLEMLLYNMRHVQHHTGQLNMILRNNIDNSPKWVSQAL